MRSHVLDGKFFQDGGLKRESGAAFRIFCHL